MSRTRVAVALLLVSAGAAVVLLASVAGATTSRPFHYSHRVVVEGLYVDHWTMDETFPCGRVGDGTVTVKWQFKKLTKVRLYYDKYAGGPNGTSGSWVLGSPAEAGSATCPPSLAPARSRSSTTRRSIPMPVQQEPHAMKYRPDRRE